MGRHKAAETTTPPTVVTSTNPGPQPLQLTTPKPIKVAKKANSAVKTANFSFDELSKLLRILDDRMPQGANEWAAVEHEFNSGLRQADQRSKEQLKNKYIRMRASDMKPTPACPIELIQQAVRIQEKIEKQSGIQTFDGIHTLDESEVDCVLDAVKKYLPADEQEQWEAVATNFNESIDENNHRTVEYLRHIFDSLRKQSKPTGDPHCPNTVRRAKHIWRKVEERLSGHVELEISRTGNDAGTDEDDAAGHNREETQDDDKSESSADSAALFQRQKRLKTADDSSIISLDPLPKSSSIAPTTGDSVAIVAAVPMTASPSIISTAISAKPKSISNQFSIQSRLGLSGLTTNNIIPASAAEYKSKVSEKRTRLKSELVAMDSNQNLERLFAVQNMRDEEYRREKRDAEDARAERERQAQEKREERERLAEERREEKMRLAEERREEKERLAEERREERERRHAVEMQQMQLQQQQFLAMMMAAFKGTTSGSSKD